MRTGKGRRQVSESMKFLVTNRADLEGFEDIEDFVFASGPSNQRYRDAFEHHFIAVRQAVATVLWSREIFIGASVLDALLFRAVAHTLTADPVRLVLEYIRDQGLHGRGLVVSPG
jgi:hypothetical protein